MRRRTSAMIVAALALGCAAFADSGKEAKLMLTQGAKPACTVVAVTGKKPELLMTRAVETITGTVKRWSGVGLPAVMLKEDAKQLPQGPAVVLTTVERLRKVAPDVETSDHLLMRVQAIDPQGFACVPVGEKLFVVARTPRGVYNGAVYLSDFRIDGPRDGLTLSVEPIVRSPGMDGRAAYTLNIWGDEAKYTAEHWNAVLDRFAYDGIDQVYFWVSGHFPSKKYPQTYRCKDGNFDSTMESGIPTIKDQKAIIRHAHDMGLTFYLGSGLGGWCGTGLLTNKAPGTMKQGPGIRAMSLCPSSPASRKALIEYYKEMYDALPEADGMYIEMADEWGDCQCPVCSKPVDEFGSKQFGQSQITLIQEIAHEIWKDHPKARFALTVGYTEHKSDPAFYEVIRQMNDPRFEYMEARGSWKFAGPGGRELPVSYFSPKVMHWSQHYGQPLEAMVANSNRIVESGFYGYTIAYEPGAGTGSFYREIPFDPNILPYALTGFVYREMTWEPTLSLEQMQARVQERFFGREAPDALGRDIWALREFIRTCAGAKELTAEQKSQLDQIEQHIREAKRSAGPKTLDGLRLMERAVHDTLRHFGMVR